MSISPLICPVEDSFDLEDERTLHISAGEILFVEDAALMRRSLLELSSEAGCFS